MSNPLTPVRRSLSEGGKSTESPLQRRIDVILIAITIAIIVLIASSSAHAQNFTYDFPGTPGSGSAAAQTNAQPAGGSFSDFTRVGVTSNSGANIFNSRDWSQSTTIDTTLYTTYSATPTAGNISFLQQISFVHDRSNTGPTSGQVSLFGNTAATAIASQTFSPATGDTTTTFNFSDIISGEALTFRFYGWNAGGASGTLSFDNVATTGATPAFQASSANLALTSATLVYADASALTLSGNITGVGGLEKIGTNTVTLTGINSYTGATTVSAGTLLINGNQILATGQVTVNNTGTLGGGGTTGGAVDVKNGGKLAPGGAAGTTANLNVGNGTAGALTLEAG